MLKEFAYAAALIVGTAGIAHAQVTVAESNRVDAGEDANGNSHYSESRDTVQQGRNGSVTRHESISQDRTTSRIDDNSDRVEEVVPTGAVRSDEIKRTETGRIVLDND